MTILVDLAKMALWVIAGIFGMLYLTTEIEPLFYAFALFLGGGAILHVVTAPFKG